jgi:hypothetical protein
MAFRRSINPPGDASPQAAPSPGGTTPEIAIPDVCEIPRPVVVSRRESAVTQLAGACKSDLAEPNSAQFRQMITPQIFASI